MSFTTLPNEILSMIFKQCLLSGGFQDLSLSCKRCYLVGRQYAEKHKEQMQRWELVNIEDGRIFPHQTKLQTVRIILENLDRARWARQLYFHIGPGIIKERTDLESWVTHVTSRPWFTTIFGKDAQLPWHEMLWFENDEKFETGRQKEYQCSLAYMVLLFLLMHNLDTIYLPSLWRYSEEADYFVLDKVALQLRIQQSSTEPTKSKFLPLSNLRCVRLVDARLHDHTSRYRFKIIAPFLGLPGLETLHVTYLIAVDDFSSGLSFEWPYRRFVSNLKTIELRRCCFETKGVSELLSHTPRLQSFTYTHERQDKYGEYWNAGAFINAVGKSVGKTLLHLSITCGDDSDITAGAYSLSDFTTLETCRLSLNIICAPPLDGAFTVIPGDDSNLTRWTISSMREVLPGIEEIMPISIKTFILEVHDSGRMSAENFAALQILFRSRQKIATLGTFLNLQHLNIDMYGGLQGLDSIKQLLRTCGVRIRTMRR